MTQKNNKYYSNRQESMVADYLEWKQVSGSGSRPFTPGDLTSDHWLGECKTHDTIKDKVVFHKSHWFKICEEAYAKCKIPILFVDTGTQQAKDTWVMFPSVKIHPEVVNIIDGLKNTSTKGNTLTFDPIDARSLYRQGSLDGKVNIFKLFWDQELAVMPLSVFRDFLQEWF